MYTPQSIREVGKRHQAANKKLIVQLARVNHRDLDDRVHELHDEAFEQIDCLTCANCCKTTSPIFRDADIVRISKRLRMKPSELITAHLHMDNDGDYVLNSSPCVFLEDDNTCRIYDDRPGACREYPHTDRKRVYQLFDLTLKNSLVCPAVQHILDHLRKEFF